MRQSEAMTKARYEAHQFVIDGVAVVQLCDLAQDALVSVAPSIGNMAYEFSIAGEQFLWFPFESPAELKAKPTFCGIPFLAPWANRLDGDTYWVNGRRYQLNAELGNIRRDGHQKPIHGLLNFSSHWQHLGSGADEASAWTTSRLDFTRYPELLAQFPFAHTISMTHRLSEGELEVITTLVNDGSEALPVAVGYHPYFQLPGVPRDQWSVHLAARDHLLLDDMTIPTGVSRPLEFADPYSLQGAALDDVFANLVRDPGGHARFWVDGGGRRITVTYGAKYPVAIVYAPAGHDFICFEPMSAVTNAFNLTHDGIYKELQSVAPGEAWRESYWISVQR